MSNTILVKECADTISFLSKMKTEHGNMEREMEKLLNQAKELESKLVKAETVREAANNDSLTKERSRIMQSYSIISMESNVLIFATKLLRSNLSKLNTEVRSRNLKYFKDR